ncbi:Sec1 family protein, partial [Helicosporidium sp. ATCC 50920]
MDVVEIMRSYVGRMLRDVKGMKVLLLDAETTDMVACAYSQSEVLEQEVYLVQRLDDDSKEPMLHLKAVCFLRPTRENIVRLCRQLREPRFAEFHLYFSNRVDDLRMQELAEADSQERVASLQEAFGDWVPLDSSLFWIPISRPWAGLCRWGVDWSASSALVDRS